MNEEAKARWRKRLDGLAPPPETTDDRILRMALSIHLLPDMAKDQEPLGAEFEAVWDAHVDELYEP